jgi:GT2 family glycosyltransferase
MSGAASLAVVAPSRVAVVLLNWRAPEMTLAALGQVMEQSVAPSAVFVVENGSGDRSPDLLAEGVRQYGSAVRLLVNTDNLGFGGGCNTALRAILEDDFDWVWLLNNDAAPEPDCLARLLEAAAAAGEQTGLVGTLLTDPEQTHLPHFGSWLDPVTLICHAVRQPGDVERHRFSWMTAASLLVSTAALRTVGLFDERFFMYWEDADLNMRMRQNGYRIVAAPQARAYHSAGTSSRGLEVRRYVWHFVSQRLWISKHHPAPKAAKGWLVMKYLLKAAADRDFERAKALCRAAVRP